MKGERLGEFEELLLLAVLAVEGPPSVVLIQQYLEGVSSRSVSLGAVYAGLDRLERKALVRSAFGEATPTRGGKRKRVFSITPEGERTARAVRHTREAIWKAIEER